MIEPRRQAGSLHSETLGEALAARGTDSNNNFLLLRLFAASAVVYGHSWSLGKCANCTPDLIQYTLQWHYAGEVGLLILFTISGFLVTASFDRRGRLFPYLLSRAARILPGLIAFCVVVAFIAGPILTSLDLRTYFSDPRLYGFFWTNVTLQSPRYDLPGVFEHNRYGPAAVGTLWTLWIEVRLYLLVALAGMFGAVSNKFVGNSVLIAFGAWAALSPTTFPLLPITEDNSALVSYFAVGTFVYINRDHIPLRTEIAVFAVIAVVLSRKQPGYEYVVRGAIAYGVLWLAFLPKLALPRWIADYSYGIYLYGWPVQQIIAMLAPELSAVYLAIIALPIAWLCGFLSWHLVEKVPLKWKHRTYRESRAAEEG